MNRLTQEQQRLYPADAPRALVLALSRPADWAALSALWQGLQADLELPAPGIALSGSDAFQLWFALEAAVPEDEGLRFLQALCTRYLPGVPAARLRLVAGAPCAALPLPPQQVLPEQWSAFVTPDLAAMFADTPWLDMQPGDDAQAGLLQGLRAVSAKQWASAWRVLVPVHAPSAQAVPPTPAPTATAATNASTSYPTDTPARFLTAVMQDAHAPLALRVEAAKALLNAALP